MRHVCSEYDMIGNYKVLQETFNRLNVDKYIEASCALPLLPTRQCCPDPLLLC